MEAPQNATSCAVAPTSGLYNIAKIEGHVSDFSNATVYCEVDNNGVGYIDLVKTSQSSQGLNFINSIFSSSNSSSLEIKAAVNINNIPGILIQNLGNTQILILTKRASI